MGGLSGNKSPEGGSESLRGKGALFFSALFFASCKILQPLQEEENGGGGESSLLLAHFLPFKCCNLMRRIAGFKKSWEFN